MVADTKSISAMYQSALKSTPATRPSKFLLRQILKPMRRNADALRFSISHGTCSVRRLARLPGARQRAASKTAWIGDGRLGSSTQQVGRASRDAPTATALVLHRSGQIYRHRLKENAVSPILSPISTSAGLQGVGSQMVSSIVP